MHHAKVGDGALPFRSYAGGAARVVPAYAETDVGEPMTPETDLVLTSDPSRKKDTVEPVRVTAKCCHTPTLVVGEGPPDVAATSMLYWRSLETMATSTKEVV